MERSDDRRNMIIAIALSALAVLGWGWAAERFFPQPKAPVVAQGKGVAASPGSPAAPIVVRRIDPQAAVQQGARVAIETPSLKGTINLTGARLDDLLLLNHKVTVKKGSPPVRLLSPANARGSYFAGFGWSGDGLAAPNDATVWQADGTTLTPERPVTLRWSNANGQTFAIRFAIDRQYMFTVTQSVTNAGTGAVGVRPYGYVSRFGKSNDIDAWTNHVGPIGAFNAAANYEVDWDDLEEAGPAGQRFQTKGGWIGFGDLYWLTALVPDQAASIDAGFRAGSGSFQAEYQMPQSLVAPGQSASSTSRFFAGAKEVQALDGYEKAGIPLFGKAIDWGWFEILAKPFFYLLDWLFRQVGNFGVAIMLLTVIVRGVMFPIAQKQFASMAAMRVVQPKMKEIQEKYKDDKVKLQQEMMALYQKEKVNPFAGCLPILLQIPIFYALYKVLMLAIEMRHQPFFGWIKDLSAPDPAHMLNLFGLLNFEVPPMLGIGVLALLLGVTMWLQFKLNPAPMDPMQQQVFAIMPWVMMFVMAPFAAGLLIYWNTTNVLSILQQKWLYSRHPILKEAPAT